LIYFFTCLIKIKEDNPHFNILVAPFQRIQELEIKKLNFKHPTFSSHENNQGIAMDIYENYESLAEEILNKPYGVQTDDSQNPLVSSWEMINVEESYNASYDWDRRKKAIREVIISMSKLSKMLNQSFNDGFCSEIERKIEIYEFILEEFQVTPQAPDLNHFVSIFIRLQQLFQDDSTDSVVEKFIVVFLIYYNHLTKAQFSDPSLFPKAIMDIIVQPNLTKEKIFDLLK
jgi:hypothetical protein